MTLLHQFCSADFITSRQLTTGMGGLAKLNVKWTLLPDNIKNEIVAALDKTACSLNDREVANLLHTFSKLQISWRDLAPSMQDGLIESFVRHSDELISEQGSMAIYAMGLMGLQKAQLDDAVKEHIYSVTILVLGESYIHIPREVNQQVGIIKMLRE